MKSLLLLTFFAIICTVVCGNYKKKCTPVNEFENGCNNCKGCRVRDGILVCSSRTCPPPPEGKGKGSSPTLKCEPGCRFMIDCNTCFCGSDGNGAGCTKIGCNVKG